MGITVTSSDSCAVVRVDGPLNRQTSPELEKTLQSLVDKGQMRVVLDLSGVPEMSSAGLRTIISAAKRLRGGQATATFTWLRPVNEWLKCSNWPACFRCFTSSTPAHKQKPASNR